MGDINAAATRAVGFPTFDGLRAGPSLLAESALRARPVDRM